MKVYSTLFLGLFLSCTQMRYISSNSLPTYVSAREEHTDEFTVRGKKEFYLWGNFPSFHVVEIDKELAKRNIISASDIELKEFMSLESFVYRVISFGLYTPIDYEITAKGKIPRSGKN